MKKKTPYAGIALLLLMAVMTVLFLKVYDISDRDMRNETPDVRISAQNLVSSFLENESQASKAYVDKTMEVSGIVKEVSYLNDRYTLFLDGGETFACLMCDMDTDQASRLKKLVPGQTIRVKGVCKGFLLDAILLNCIVLE